MPVDGWLTCQEVVELITDYLENALLPQKMEQLEKHFAACPPCMEYLKQVKLIIELLSKLTQSPAIPSMKKREFLQIFQNWQQDSSHQITRQE
ncbi:MAG TPA: zf-HC2 domain-containing protein [Ktedonobacteraceae bacterium]